MHRIWMRSLALVATASVLTAALWIFNPPSAAACSCEQLSSISLERGDAVVVGTVTNIGEAPAEWEGQQRFVAEVSVQTDLKDNLADIIYVTSERDDGGNCGVSWQLGTRIAAVIYEDAGVLRTDGCSTMQPALAEGWQPAATVGGEATLLIGGSQPYRMVAYDETGTAIAFGFDEGFTHDASVCPGAENMIEIVSRDAGPNPGTVSLETRSLASFEIVDSVVVAADGDVIPFLGLRCDTPDGSEATTTQRRVVDGSVEPQDEIFGTPAVDLQASWPNFESRTAGTIPVDYWMSVAIELDQPVPIDATGRTAPVIDLGSGNAFGLVQQDDSEPAAAAEDDGSSNSLVWAGVVGIAIGITFAVVRGKRRN